jgi:hypothetical protein
VTRVQPSAEHAVHRLSARETAGVAADVLAPLVARGVIVRRPRIVGALDRLDADRRAVRRLQRLRSTHGPGPVLLRVPGRDVALVLAADDARRVLEGSPEPSRPTRARNVRRFSTSNRMACWSRTVPSEHTAARSTSACEPERPVHALGNAFASKVAEEAEAMLT